ncbi:hypothetical protein H8356DRAFT_1306906 [Neocallimastix lanati (nom. inval.)]|nr:hypothetical protein H8356DRAFT_1306906 [Neocallimastix sp. JGI-2020a]
MKLNFISSTIALLGASFVLGASVQEQKCDKDSDYYDVVFKKCITSYYNTSDAKSYCSIVNTNECRQLFNDPASYFKSCENVWDDYEEYLTNELPIIASYKAHASIICQFDERGNFCPYSKQYFDKEREYINQVYGDGGQYISHETIDQNEIKENCQSNKCVYQYMNLDNEFGYLNVPRTESNKLFYDLREEIINDPIETSTTVEDPIKTSSTNEDPIETSTTIENLIETSTTIEDPIETSTAIEDPIETSTTTENPIETSTTVEDPIKTSSTNEDSIETSTTIENLIETSTTIEDPIETSTAIEDPIETSITIENPVETSTTNNVVPTPKRKCFVKSKKN